MDQNQFKLIFASVQELTISDHDNPNFGNKPALSLNFAEFSVYIQRYVEFILPHLKNFQ